ncbi:MAG: tRNA preQ1(34) S-adenosylmethionine ribosyltransferase-isomerase QueA [Firmicutes bacterium]|nr:tRNA preQ1(34) S-adenosylmethionine ribosyltransferase-isomerase QueA [Bacillota bacterium]
MDISEFDYALPQELIAQRPAVPRDASRLLVVRREAASLEHKSFRDIRGLLDPGDVLVLNDTRVMPWRLVGRKSDTGGRLELLLLEERGDGLWEALVRPGRAKPGLSVVFGSGTLTAELRERFAGDGGKWLVSLRAQGDVRDAVASLGTVPLPPYIKEPVRHPEEYQTVYASQEGSVAAPTAGLHFTPELLLEISRRGVGVTRITLHVGPGTFRPVRCQRVEEHRMDEERYVVGQDTADSIHKARSRGKRVVAVGTSATRVLETVASKTGEISPGHGRTGAFLYPGHRFKVVDALITNFHLPRSTPLILACAFGGRELVLQAYREAIGLGYRFYSFGDAMLICVDRRGF